MSPGGADSKEEYADATSEPAVRSDGATLASAPPAVSATTRGASGSWTGNEWRGARTLSLCRGDVNEPTLEGVDARLLSEARPVPEEDATDAGDTARSKVGGAAVSAAATVVAATGSLPD